MSPYKRVTCFKQGHQKGAGHDLPCHHALILIAMLIREEGEGENIELTHISVQSTGDVNVSAVGGRVLFCPRANEKPLLKPRLLSHKCLLLWEGCGFGVREQERRNGKKVRGEGAETRWKEERTAGGGKIYKDSQHCEEGGREFR